MQLLKLCKYIIKFRKSIFAVVLYSKPKRNYQLTWKCKAIGASAPTQSATIPTQSASAPIQSTPAPIQSATIPIQSASAPI